MVRKVQGLERLMKTLHYDRVDLSEFTHDMIANTRRNFILSVKEGLPGHAIYARARNASEILENLNLEKQHRVAAVRTRRGAGSWARVRELRGGSRGFVARGS